MLCRDAAKLLVVSPRFVQLVEIEGARRGLVKFVLGPKSFFETLLEAALTPSLVLDGSSEELVALGLAFLFPLYGIVEGIGRLLGFRMNDQSGCRIDDEFRLTTRARYFKPASFHDVQPFSLCTSQVRPRPVEATPKE